MLLERFSGAFGGINSILQNLAQQIETIQTQTGGTIQGAIRALFGSLSAAFGRMVDRLKESVGGVVNRLGIPEKLETIGSKTAGLRSGGGRLVRSLTNAISIGSQSTASQLEGKLLRKSKTVKVLMGDPTEKLKTNNQNPYPDATEPDGQTFAKRYQAWNRMNMKPEDSAMRSLQPGSRIIDPTLLSKNIETPELKGLREFANLTQMAGRNLAELIEHPLVKLSQVAKEVGNQVEMFLAQPATRVGAAWLNTINYITGKVFPMLWAGASTLGRWLVDKLNHGAADVTAAAWVRTEKAFDEVTTHMTETATHAGEAIAEGIGSAKTGAGRLMGVISNIGSLSMSLSGLGMALTSVNPVLGGLITGFSESLFLAESFIGSLGSIAEIAPNVFGLLGDGFSMLKPAIQMATSAVQGFGIKLIAMIRVVGAAIISSPATLGIAALVAGFGILYTAIRTDLFGLGKLFDQISQKIKTFFGSIPIPYDQIHSALDAIRQNVLSLPIILTLGTAALVGNFERLPFSEILVSKFKEALTAVAPIGEKIAATITPQLLKARGLMETVGSGGVGATNQAASVFGRILEMLKRLPNGIRNLPDTLESTVPKLIRRWDIFNKLLLKRWFPRFFARLRKSFLAFFTKVTTLTTRQGGRVTKAAEKAMPSVAKSGISAALSGGVRPKISEPNLKTFEESVEGSVVKFRSMWDNATLWIEKHVVPKLGAAFTAISTMLTKLGIKTKAFGKGVLNLFFRSNRCPDNGSKFISRING